MTNPTLPNFDWFADLRPFQAAFEAWKAGNYAEPTRFYLNHESDGPFSVAAGAGLLVAEMRRFKLNSPEIVQRLGSARDPNGRMLFDESFLNHLQRLRFRGKLSIAVEGTFLLPGEPVLVVEASRLQGLLLTGILNEIVWKSTSYATSAALKNWQTGLVSELEIPAEPVFENSPDGLKKRAEFIGGNQAGEQFSSKKRGKTDGYQPDNSPKMADGLTQIRRCFKGSEPVADVWLTEAQEDSLPGGLRSLNFQDVAKNESKSVQFTRFQNLFQPVLLDGHPTFSSPKAGFLRQRTFKLMEAFHDNGLENYPRGPLI